MVHPYTRITANKSSLGLVHNHLNVSAVTMCACLRSPQEDAANTVAVPDEAPALNPIEAFMELKYKEELSLTNTAFLRL